MTRHRCGLVPALLICLGTVVTGAPPASAAAAPHDTVVEALEHDAHPLRTVEPNGDTSDLPPLTA